MDYSTWPNEEVFGFPKPLRVDGFEVANEEHPEVNSRSDARPSVTSIEFCHGVFDKPIKVCLMQQLTKSLIKYVSGTPSNLTG